MTDERIAWIDNARALACLMVVLLHAAAPYLYEFGRIRPAEWMFANIIDSLMRPAAPVFFMISGYFFLATDRAPRLRHVLRLGAALLFYSACALAYRALTGEAVGLPQVAAALVNPAFYHLWFFYALITLYLLMMLVRLRPAALAPALALAVLMVLLNPTLGSLAAMAGVATWPDSPALLDGSIIVYLGYAMAGALFRGWQGGTRAPAALHFWAGFLCASALIALLTHVRSSADGAFAEVFYDITNVLVAAQSVTLFAAIRCTRAPWPGARWIAALSLPIYGLHALVLDLRHAAGWFDAPWTAYVVIPLSFVLATALSAAAGLLLRRIDRRSWVH